VFTGHVCTEHFEGLAKATVTGLGRPGHRIVVLPADVELVEVWSDPEAIRRYAEQVVEEIFGGSDGEHRQRVAAGDAQARL
jgi:hypothetical protein